MIHLMLAFMFAAMTFYVLGLSMGYYFFTFKKDEKLRFETFAKFVLNNSTPGCAKCALNFVHADKVLRPYRDMPKSLPD